jgi:hypothetical protein
MADGVHLIIDGAVLEEVLRGPAGPVARYVIDRATLVQVTAKARAPRRTGCLEDSIVKRPERFGDEFAVRIVSDTSPCSPSHTSYSLFVHEGTSPHDIPNAFGYGNTFGIGGRFDGKFHPGNKPDPFLRDALSVLAT